jgi:cation-transporting P-type ATPase E
MQCTSIDFLGATDTSLSSHVLGHLANDPAANSTLRAIADRFPPQHSFTETSAIPFDSKRKWKAVQLAECGTWFLGAPEMLLPQDQKLQELVQHKAEQGQRVLLLAVSQKDLNSDVLPDDLSASVIISIEEEIRDDAAQTIEFFQQQNVEIFVLSGDHPTTVEAIARKIGIEKDHVFGRVTPEQKREFVNERHRNSDVVAMTGDGVNDVLALKNADIGIAMDNAAPATKAVAELILLDGKFSHLPTVIDEGRRVIGNVERVAHVFLTKNVMSIVAIVSVALFSRQFPFLPRQMTLVSSLAIGIPAFFLAIGSSSPRYVPGLLQRVMLFALPAGLVTGVSVIVADSLSAPADGTAASITALISFLWIISLFARPLTGARLVLLLAMAISSLLAIAIPTSAQFFAFTVQQDTVIPGLLGGLCAGVVIEITHRIRR